MATQPRSTAAGTRDPGEAAPLTPDEQDTILATDTADTAVRSASPDFTGKRLRAIPAIITNSGDRGTTVEITSENFRAKGIDHRTVSFDRRKDNYTLPVGNEEGQISEKAANFLAKNYPTSFEFMDNGG